MQYGRSASQPLVTRPGYGDGRPATPVGESGLPGTGPADRGIGLDKDIPGESTYNKPENDIREPDKAEPGSIYRIDGPDDRAKPQDDPDGDERHHEDFKPTFTGPGGRPPDDPTVTDYPYRDKHKDKHYASEQAEFVLGLYQLGFAREATIRLGSGMVRTAARMDDMLSGLNPATDERSAQCSVQVKRVDTSNLRWIFAVNCGNGAKVVRLKGTREGNIVKLSKMDLNVSCSCPGWRWLGPEHHAQQGDYLDGKLVGTASTPVIKDPQRHNRVCKHVTAVLSHIRGWAVPLEKPKSKEK